MTIERQYAKDLRDQYDARKLSKEEFLAGVLEVAIERAHGKGYVEKGTKALVELSKKHGRGRFIPVQEIRAKAEIESPSGGVYPWYDGSAGVLVEQKRPHAVRIKDEFYDAMLKLFERPSDTDESSYEELLSRVTVDPRVCTGKPCIRGTRIYIAIILDALAEGLTLEQIIDHYPSLTKDDIRAALAYAAELARENVWRLATGS